MLLQHLNYLQVNFLIKFSGKKAITRNEFRKISGYECMLFFLHSIGSGHNYFLQYHV